MNTNNKILILLTALFVSALLSSPSFAHEATEEQKAKHVGRTVSTGVMPDFNFTGKGLLVASVSDGSPAASAGLQKGDVIITLAGNEVSDLRSYSTELTKHSVGDTIEVGYMRDNDTHKIKLTLAARPR